MAGHEISYPLPSSYLSANEAEWNNIQLTFVPYSVAAIEGLRGSSPDIPDVAYVFGDNWAFLLTANQNPKSKGEKMLKRKDPEKLFWNVHLIEQRFDGAYRENLVMLEEYLEALHAEESEGLLDGKSLDKIAILDRTSFAFPLFDEERVELVESKSWGRIIRVFGFNTLIYHIQRELHPKLRIHL